MLIIESRKYIDNDSIKNQKKKKPKAFRGMFVCEDKRDKLLYVILIHCLVSQDRISQLYHLMISYFLVKILFVVEAELETNLI